VYIGILCIVFFLLSFPFVLGNGLYLFQLFDQFAGTVPLLLIGFFEFIAVGWVCGVKRYVLLKSVWCVSRFGLWCIKYINLSEINL